MRPAPPIDLARRPEPATSPAAGRRTPGPAVHPDPKTPSDSLEHLLARMLDALWAYLDPDFAIAYLVDVQGFQNATSVRRAAGYDAARVETLVRLVRQLEPVDPFSPKRAEAAGAAVMSAANLGGEERHARSAHGIHLQRHGYRTPLAVFLRRAGRVAAGVLLVRDVASPPFGRREVRLLGELHPFLELTFDLSATPLAVPLLEVAETAHLTTREAEIAQLVAGGASNAEIAVALRVGESTVKAHLTKVYAKLDVRSRTQLAILLGVRG